MKLRTYIRTLLNDIFLDNFFVNTIKKIVNFYFKSSQKPESAIKFSQNSPTNEIYRKKPISFQSVTGDKLDCM